LDLTYLNEKGLGSFFRGKALFPDLRNPVEAVAVPVPGLVLIGCLTRGDQGRASVEDEEVQDQDPVKGPALDFLSFFDAPSSMDGMGLAYPDKLISNQSRFVGPTGSPIVWNRENKLSHMVVNF
jgi:hypothetical protein